MMGWWYRPGVGRLVEPAAADAAAASVAAAVERTGAAAAARPSTHTADTSILCHDARVRGTPPHHYGNGRESGIMRQSEDLFRHDVALHLRCAATDREG